MTKTNRTGVRASLALVGAVAAALFAAAPASAAKLGGSTLAPNQQTFEALADYGVTTSPVGKAKLNDKGLHFPLASGKVDPETGKAKFVHTGGLEFSANGMSLTVENFIVKVASKKNVLKAELPDGSKLRFADLNVKKLDIQEKKNGKFVYSNIKAKLSKKGAKALTSELGLPDATGAKLGVLTTKYKGDEKK